jgi:hypothetical protein
MSKQSEKPEWVPTSGPFLPWLEGTEELRERLPGVQQLLRREQARENIEVRRQLLGAPTGLTPQGS